jgi:hypothetical protein
MCKAAGHRGDGMIALLRTRVGLAAAAAIVLVGATLGAAVTLARVSGNKGTVPASSVPGVLQTPQSGSCTTVAQAKQVWTDVSTRLDALVLHPDLSGVDAVAQGNAAAQMRQYIQQRLLDHNLTEREKSRLDDLSVVQPGCGSQPLTVRVTETLMQDDYLASDGHVDHVDAAVGQAQHLLETYVRSGSTWKVADIASLDQSPAPGSTV